MRISRPMVAGVAAATVLALSVAGCGGNKAPSPTKSGSATSSTSTSAPSASSAPVQPNDYTGWLIQATDIEVRDHVTVPLHHQFNIEAMIAGIHHTPRPDGHVLATDITATQ